LSSAEKVFCRKNERLLRVTQAYRDRQKSAQSV
jgi:hypothetical protein